MNRRWDWDNTWKLSVLSSNPYLSATTENTDEWSITTQKILWLSYQLIKNGVKVKIPDVYGNEDTIEIIKVIDWNDPGNNDYFLTSQFWITSEMYDRRPSEAIRKGLLDLAKERGSRHYGKGVSEAYDLRKGDDR